MPIANRNPFITSHTFVIFFHERDSSKFSLAAWEWNIFFFKSGFAASITAHYTYIEWELHTVCLSQGSNIGCTFYKMCYFIIHFSINLMPFRIYVYVWLLSRRSARNFQGSLSFSALATIFFRNSVIYTPHYISGIFFTCWLYAHKIFNLTSYASVWHTFFWWRDDTFYVLSCAIVFDDYRQCHETIA